MKSGARDKVEGKVHRAKGHIKEVAGKATGDESLEAEGKVEKASGKTQEKVGEVKNVFGK
jgi:uncharacterized protein YjbJ (UPF0337 family)